MTNISLLLAALLLAALQQQLLVVDGGSYHKEVPRKQHSTQPHQHRHQHFLSDTSKTSQQQQQQHHHQQHHRGHARHQQQRQQQPHNKQSSLWQQEYKLKAAMSTEPTTTITTTKTDMHKKHNFQNHHHHHQQQQQQQGQGQQKELQQHHQVESIMKRFAAIAAAAGSDVAHFDATHTAVKGQRQPLLLSTSTEASSSTLTEVSKFSSSKDASATSNQLKTSASSAASLSSTSSSSSSLSSSSSPFSSLTKSSSPQLADANRTQHYKSSSDAVVAADDRRLRLKSIESLDYADDYYYDDGDDDEDEETNNNNDDDDDVDGDDGHNKQNNNNNADDVASMENYDSDFDAERRPHISSTHITTNSARVVRDHHHHHDHHRRQHYEPLDFIASGKTSRLDHQATKPSLPSLSPHYLNEPSQYLDHDQQQLLASDQDYADDEPYRSSGENYLNDAPGVLTDQKFRELGTLEAVQQARDKMLQEQEHMRQKTPAELAREHMDRMKTAGRCSRPLPRVIHVSNETSKRYVPYCTILHRCGEDTGCCDSTRQVCAAKSFEDVPVYFFVIKVNSRSNKRDTEVLMLRNHTECHCVNRSNLSASLQYMPRDKRSDMQRRRYHHSQQYTQRSFYEDSLADDMSNMICRCPKHFDIFPVEVPYAERHSSDNASSIRCRCDCLSHNVPCRRLQQGEEGFAVDERKCIGERICQAPVCLHGDYSHQTGRCPRRKNHKRTVTRYDYGYG